MNDLLATFRDASVIVIAICAIGSSLAAFTLYHMDGREAATFLVNNAIKDCRTSVEVTAEFGRWGHKRLIMRCRDMYPGVNEGER